MYLVLHSTYHTVEVALCSFGAIIDSVCIDKYDASAHMIVAVDTLCKRTHRMIGEIGYIVVHAGPGPFTTLRAVLATANGLATAMGIRLVAVDGLRALINEYHDTIYPITISLLNAYSGDVYYAIEDHKHVTTGIFYGIESLKQVLQQFPTTMTIRCIGNGVPMHEKLLHEVCGARVFIPKPNPETCSLQAVTSIGFEQWMSQQDIVEQVLPLYLKKY